MGDCTGLIYGLLFETEKSNISGLLVGVDSKKAFDSTSWEFLYNKIIFLALITLLLNRLNYL